MSAANRCGAPRDSDARPGPCRRVVKQFGARCHDHQDYDERPPVIEALANLIARQFAGWNDDTTEPEIEDPVLRAMAEAHWERINANCLLMGRAYAEAIVLNFDVRYPRTSPNIPKGT